MNKIVILLATMCFHGTSLAYQYTTKCSVEHIIFTKNSSHPEVEKSTTDLIVYKKEEIKRVTIHGLLVDGSPIILHSPPLNESLEPDGFKKWEYSDNNSRLTYFYTSNWLHLEFGSNMQDSNKQKTTDIFLIRNCN
ncbi:hypothetical protein AACK17_00755 [Pectobacterium punjabense]|uniref:hypothetical protein n=1 Tax=Pectobacterium TaxID=122277 RepID=UPI000EB24011|nr:hypothetical protein [Pectobacterium parmentieri]AYH27175.1 hypothetical protein C5E20_08530 [Pectobacterium parmentieri]